MTDEEIKNIARARVAELVQRFHRNETDYLRAVYNETQARTDFVTPLLEAFGWDVHNQSGHPLALREVIEEATVEVGEERLSKRPDYELRLARQRKLFVEAKKPSVHLERDRAPAFQTRRYGYSASLPISVLTNFHQLAIYDCRPIPAETDEAHVARLLLLRYDQFEARFDDLWPLLSRHAVYSGQFDQHFSIDATRHGAEQFDDFFLGQVRSWRERLAVDIHANTPGLTPTELTYAVQLFLSRIVFLRICEDREIERYESLKSLVASNTFDALLTELRRADAFYNSGLFRLLDDDGLAIRISDSTLQSIISELYYPQSPYTFAVVETEVLGEIYEQFLGEVITIEDGTVHIVSKPEVRESGGVVPTPRYIVDAIVSRTLLPALENKSPADLAGFTVADPCCGSGIFLLSVFEFLLDHHLSWYLTNDQANQTGRTIFEVAAGEWRLTFEEKRRILLEHMRGVDIDPNAVEVARFSLLLKLIEDETAVGLREYVDRHRTPALPTLDTIVRSGNSLISPEEWADVNGPMSGNLIDKINPFSWPDEFVEETGAGGFDVIVANPPYIRIQNMTNYSPEEVLFYRNPTSPYTTARQDNFDKYALFVERALTLIRPNGRLGMIVPHKFMTIQAGQALRRLLTAEPVVEEVVNFGVKQVFGRNISNYTCILILDKSGPAQVTVEQVGPLEAWRYGAPGAVATIPSTALTEAAWQFASAETTALFNRVRAAHPSRLGSIAEIFVGVQTSADPVYIFRAVAETETTKTLRWNNKNWPIESSILRPCLHDASLTAFSRPEPNAWMIFPYILEDDGDGGTEVHLIQPAEMRERYPKCFTYLKARRTELDKRNVTGGAAGERQFYQFGRSQSLIKFDSPKIILPILSKEPRYAYDDTDVVVTGGGNGPYYMIRPRQSAITSNYYLLAVLNHPLCEAIIRTHTSPFRGGYYSHGKQFIEDLPIPEPSAKVRRNIETNVIELIGALTEISAARTPHQRTVRERRVAELKTTVESQITQAFGLSTADMEIVRAVPVPT